jgi:hypothetical protein
MRIPLLVALLLLPPAAWAQDEEEEEGSVDIGDVGSSRIGGPGLTKEEKAWNASADEEDIPLTEDTLPKVGDKKRIPALHKLGKQYSGSQAWKDACEKYDQIETEASVDAIAEDPEGKKSAGKSYVECARIAFGGDDFDKAEKLLAKSEKLIGSDHRHQGLRRKMMREAYRKKVSDGDISGAVTLFKQFQAQEANEDERIWFGEQLATRAKEAHESKDEVTRNEMMKYLSDVAPMNTEYRKLKDEIDTNKSILGNALMWCGAVVALVLVLGWFTKWRASAKLSGEGGMPVSGKKNKFIDDEI